MKKKLSLLMVAFLGVVGFVLAAAYLPSGTVLAAEETGEDELPLTLTFPDYNDKGVSNYTSEWTATVDGKTWTLNGFNNNSSTASAGTWTYVRCGRKDNAHTATLTTPVVNAVATNVVYTVNKTSDIESVTFTILNGETEVKTTDITESWQAGDVNVHVEAGQKGYSYRLTINSTAASANGTTEISKVAVYGEGQYEEKHIANTIDTPYTVAEAYDLIDAGEALTDVVYVKGIISSKKGFYSGGVITYNISDDGTTDKELTIYNGKGLDGAEFESIDDIEVGATVIVKGNLLKYNSTYEINAGNELAKYTAPATDVEISPESGDISTALATAIEGKNVGNITINLAEGASYTLTSSIVAPASFTLNGNGATIDASGLEGAMVTTPEGELAEWFVGDFLVKDVTINGLAKALYASAGKNYLYDSFKVENSIIEFTANITYFDFTKGGVANLTINNSTLYGAVEHTKTLYSSQSAQRPTDYNADAAQTFTITNSTLYNIAKGANFFTHRSNSQKWLTYIMKNSIFVNVGKSGQVVKGINGGGSSTNPVYDIDGNAFNFDGEDTSASETTGNDDVYPVKNSIAGTIEFTDATAGDFGGEFTLAEGATEPETLGDPRWTVTFKTATGIESIKVNNADGEAWYNLNGMRVEKPANSGIYIHNGKKVVIK